MFSLRTIYIMKLILRSFVVKGGRRIALLDKGRQKRKENKTTKNERSIISKTHFPSQISSFEIFIWDRLTSVESPVVCRKFHWIGTRCFTLASCDHYACRRPSFVCSDGLANFWILSDKLWYSPRASICHAASLSQYAQVFVSDSLIYMKFLI